MNTAARIAGLVLAAGASRRLGTPKQLLLGTDGVPLVVRAARQLLDAGCRPVVIVTGADAVRVERAVAVGLSSEHAGDVRVVHNARHADGMGRSIACGVSMLASDPTCLDVAGVLIATCDMPSVTVPHLVALLAGSAGGAVRCASAYESPRVSVAHESVDAAPVMRGIPAVLPRADWTWLEALDADTGAKPLLMHADTVAVALTGGTVDLDTPADVEAWRSAAD